MTLTATAVRAALDYSAETGKFTWRHRPDVRKETNTMFAGKPAGRINQGYLEIGIGGKRYLAHRLAWLYVYGCWPSDQIDHINGLRADNRIINLRIATNAQNSMNQCRRSDNTSGFKGVSRHKKAGRWQAYVNVDGKHHHLGLFDLPEQAHAARCKAAIVLHGRFAKL